MARKAIIETATGRVANVIEIEDGAKWTPPVGHTLVDAAKASPGDVWDGVKFSPKPPTAEEVAAQQAAAAEVVKVTKRAEAKARAQTAILANKTGAPWGAILYDMAVAQGLIEP